MAAKNWKFSPLIYDWTASHCCIHLRKASGNPESSVRLWKFLWNSCFAVWPIYGCGLSILLGASACMKLGMYEEAGMWCDKGLAVSFYDFWNTWDIAILLRNKVKRRLRMCTYLHRKRLWVKYPLQQVIGFVARRARRAKAEMKEK